MGYLKSGVMLVRFTSLVSLLTSLFANNENTPTPIVKARGCLLFELFAITEQLGYGSCKLRANCIACSYSWNTAINPLAWWNTQPSAWAAVAGIMKMLVSRLALLGGVKLVFED
jgi:hypothetical protein